MKKADELAFMICKVIYAKLSYKIWVRDVNSAWKKKTKHNHKPKKKQPKQCLQKETFSS